MSNRLLQYVVFAFSILIAVYFGFFQPSEETQNNRGLFQQRKIPIDRARKPAEQPIRRGPASVNNVLPTEPPIGRAPTPLNQDEIFKKYGSSYEFVRDSEGVVVSIRKSGDDVKGVRRFSPNRYSDLVLRGDEIVRDLRGVLGLDPNLPLGSPQVTTGENTGQITYVQTKDGAQVEPWGKVSILLNRDGSIERIQSSALKTSKILNSQAPSPLKAGSRRILWVEQVEPIPLLLYAEETRSDGIQRIYDGQTGGLLIERDRRNRITRNQTKIVW